MSVQAELTTKPLRLQKSADWPIWLSFVRMLAESDKVWSLVDPDQDTKPAHLSEPVEPEFDDSGDIDLEAYAKWKAKMGVHKARMIRYEKQHEAFKQLGLIRLTSGARDLVRENHRAHRLSAYFHVDQINS